MTGDITSNHIFTLFGETNIPKTSASTYTQVSPIRQKILEASDEDPGRIYRNGSKFPESMTKSDQMAIALRDLKPEIYERFASLKSCTSGACFESSPITVGGEQVVLKVESHARVHVGQVPRSEYYASEPYKYDYYNNDELLTVEFTTTGNGGKLTPEAAAELERRVSLARRLTEKQIGEEGSTPIFFNQEKVDSVIYEGGSSRRIYITNRIERAGVTSQGDRLVDNLLNVLGMDSQGLATLESSLNSP